MAGGNTGLVAADAPQPAAPEEGGTHVLLIGYVELHDLQNAAWLLLAVIDKFGPIAFVLKL